MRSFHFLVFLIYTTLPIAYASRIEKQADEVVVENNNHPLGLKLVLGSFLPNNTSRQHLPLPSLPLGAGPHIPERPFQPHQPDQGNTSNHHPTSPLHPARPVLQSIHPGKRQWPLPRLLSKIPIPIPVQEKTNTPKHPLRSQSGPRLLLRN